MKEKWIPVKWHYMTKEENIKRGYPEEWRVFDCEMPEDGEEVFVTIRENCYRESRVVIRDFNTIEYNDNTYYLESGWDWYKDVIAWMPAEEPEPYRGK